MNNVEHETIVEYKFSNFHKSFVAFHREKYTNKQIEIR